ncbi:UDP-glucose-beta-D-glucan glucosyltransferase [Crocosphaera subtropica ATCC 51142]|uniref:UDP-glucose-beta-D-glucan glucosyltransferase n=1 Tax=Crocosphaera subtropica (strain ATCC 51142 / BH68) TaxID=43989 RepID=B1WT24_CROS5|nr:cellulose synthase catalytic subunit [Crocosphaera subtropica]ACB50354.1 UDP-glucose-beta-D-glucan glucosyltransferase [Crocosphaera subtropica ATCC 51142]
MFRSVNRHPHQTDQKKSILQLLLSNLSQPSIIFILLAIVGFLIAIALFDCLGEVNIGLDKIYLYLPTILLVILTQIIMKLSPHPKSWSRGLIITILIALTLRYLYWRSLSTLNLSNLTNSIFSLLLLGIELIFTFGTLLQLYLTLNVKNRSHQAAELSRDVINHQFLPSVAILITTYNEPVFILRRTILGCQNINYPHKNIYLLDDGGRKEMKQLTEELGCHYITRENNDYAKAGNLNNALNQIHEDLIAVFDADFIPSINFLNRTVGFFQSSTIALVQTNQNFYNIDPVARNLGLEQELTDEVEIFSRHYQLIRDSIETMVCYGSSFIVRKGYLDEIDGFVTESVSEDYYTGIKLSAKGYKCIYLDEKLSAGLAPENISGRLSQRLRWSRGTLQAFFIDANPLTIPGLTLIQRLAHFEGILQWFGEIPRILFLLFPLLITCFGIIPLKLTLVGWLTYGLPYYLLTWQTYRWINRYSRSAIISDLYSVSQCIPLATNVFKVLSRPFSEGFKVTPKGLSQKHFIFNEKLAFPLFILLALNCISLIYSIFLVFSDHSSILEPQLLGGFQLIWLFNLYNILILIISLYMMVDAPKSDIYHWLMVRKKVKIFELDSYSDTEGVMTKLSEIGGEIKLNNHQFSLNQRIKIKFLENDLIIAAVITDINSYQSDSQLIVTFPDLSLLEERKLIALLYGNSDQWKPKKTPGELKSIWLMLKVLVRPHFLRKSQ